MLFAALESAVDGARTSFVGTSVPLPANLGARRRSRNPF